MVETLIFALILMFINLILVYRPIPLFAFPVGLFSLYIYAVEFYADTTLPAQPFFTTFLVILVLLGLVVNGMELKG